MVYMNLMGVNFRPDPFTNFKVNEGRLCRVHGVPMPFAGEVHYSTYIMELKALQLGQPVARVTYLYPWSCVKTSSLTMWSPCRTSTRDPPRAMYGIPAVTSTSSRLA